MNKRGGQYKPTAYDSVVISPTTTELLRALEEYQDSWEAKGVPSPSMVEQCMRRSWFVGTGFPRSERVTAAGILAMEQGKAEEEMVSSLLARSGWKIVGKQVPINAEAVGCTEGTVDLILEDDYDNRYVGEIKRLGLFRYLRLVERGLKKAHPEYYTQLQLYMAGMGLTRALLVAIPADYSALTYYWNRSRHPEHLKPPPIWSEMVSEDRLWLDSRIERAKQIDYHVKVHKHPRDVPRDFDPDNDRWPCDWCNYKAACIEVGP